MGTPSFDKVSHISFSVTDADATAAWWKRVFGFVDLDTTKSDTWHAVLLLHPPTATIIEMQQHDANAGERFDPARTGFDHLGLKVGSVEALEEWQAHLEREGVTFTPIVHREYGAVLTFKDPDGIQLELFFRENHP
jgi:glyoxylase I family protein